jgi:hypothetical protein
MNLSNLSIKNSVKSKRDMRNNHPGPLRLKSFKKLTKVSKTLGSIMNSKKKDTSFDPEVNIFKI